VRVCSAYHDDVARERFVAAIERGDFATWPYDRAYAQRATAPQTLLDGARSVVCVAVPFATPPPSGRAPLTGRVSNYAWSEDYHRMLREVLDAIAAALNEAAGEPASAVVCDTAPLAERAFAARAGLGWVGKHTNVIAPSLGSFVFLGEVITKLALPEDPPLRKSCGSCTRCIAACPTGALRGDYTIDATRCISDLTQRTDAIPRALRPLIGMWVWGCDLCQLACPPNRGAMKRAVDAPNETPPAELVKLLRMRSSEFKKKYARSAMGWRGAAVLRRNAAVALGNTLDRAAVPALAASLRGDPHPMVREHAAWALGRIASPAALRALRERSALEPDERVRDEISASLEPFAGGAR